MADNLTPTSIESVSREQRVFHPAKAFVKSARINSLAAYRKLYKESITAPDKFWAKHAKQELVWFKLW